MEKIGIENPNWDKLATLVAERLKELEKPKKRFLKSAEVRLHTPDKLTTLRRSKLTTSELVF